MNLKKILSGFLAAAMAVTTMVAATFNAGAEDPVKVLVEWTGNGTTYTGVAEARPADAADNDWGGKGTTGIVNIAPLIKGYKLTDVRSISVDFTVENGNANGAIGIGAVDPNEEWARWEQDTWKSDETGTKLTATLTSDQLDKGVVGDLQIQAYWIGYGVSVTAEVTVTLDENATPSESIGKANFTYSQLTNTSMRVGDSFTVKYDSDNTPAAAKYVIKYEIKNETDDSKKWPTVVDENGSISDASEEVTGLTVSKATSGKVTTYTFTAVSGSQDEFMVKIETTAVGDWSDMDYTNSDRSLWYDGMGYYKVLPTAHTITIDPDIEKGTVTTDKVDNKAAKGEKVTLTVTPDEGYELDTLIVATSTAGTDTVTVAADKTFTMPDDDVTVTATFKAAAVKHTITVTKPTNGTVTATPTTAAKDETVTLTVTPATGYELDVLTVKEKTSGAAVTVTNKTFTMPDDDVTVTATFKAPLTAIDLDETATVLVGAEKTLTATKVPSYTTDTTAITWSSSDETVATVASDGTVTGVKAGTATITATCGTKSASCEVTVTAEAKPCTSVTLDKTTAEVTTGKTVTLKATTLPQDTTDNITWTTSNSAVATVTGGVVTGVAEGTATITVTCGTKTATCEVTVAADTTPCTGVALDKTTAEVLKGKTVTLTATATPADTTDEITWASSDTSIATVTNGVVTGVARGIATITATCGTKTATCEVSVNEEETISVPSSPFEPAKTFASAVTDGKYNENDVFVISAADVAAATSVTVTVTDSNGKKTTKDVTACYKKVTHTAADGTTDTITAGSNYLLAVTVTGIPEGTTVTVTVTVNK